METAWSTSAILVLSFLTLLIAKSLALGEDKIYTNEYAVYIPNGKEVADKLAKEHGLSNEGQIADLENYFLFTHHGISKRSANPSVDVHAKLLKNAQVEWIEQQHLKTRVKRDINTRSFPDPLWEYQWYLYSQGDTTMNIDRAWDLGFTGKGVSVSILDDGVETNHPDLRNNYSPDASYDVNDRDPDPTPRYDIYNSNQHGTRCAGEVAMEAGNNVCGVGIAFNASIGGIRMLDGAITDAVEGMSLSVRKKYVDIFSASWGPEDNGNTVDGPGRLAKAAFKSGIKRGRNGLGSIFVWASGNGGNNRDSCSCDGYANSIYTISVSSVNELGKVPWYLEECSSTLATTYSSGGRRDRKITTSDLRGGCSSQFTGTSASAPMAAGICALALEANPALTWRDLQYIIAMTANHENLDGTWVTNGAGYEVSHRYGFGLMDAEAMVRLAQDWQTLPEQKVCIVNGTPERRIITGQSTISLDVETYGCEEQHVEYLEHVQVNITLTARYRGDMSVALISPSGTRSTLLPFRIHDRRRGSFNQWIFMSTHFWGERSEGTWTFEIQNRGPYNSRGTLKGWQLILRGTSFSPLAPQRVSDSEQNVVKRDTSYEDSYYWGSISSFEDLICDPECFDGCFGEGPEECFRCKHFVDRETRACVKDCPQGYYNPLQTNKRCRKCYSTCNKCHGHDQYDCTTCNDGNVLRLDGSCGSDCGEQHYNNDGVCKRCPSLCQECSSEDTCDRCMFGMFLSNGICVRTCEGNEYIDDDGSCSACHSSCQTCFGGTEQDCMTCKNSEFFRNGLCVSDQTCGDGYYQDDSDGFASCLPCHVTCKTCDGGHPSSCTSCKDLYLRSDGNCLIFCDDGTYDNGGGECVGCPDGCALCLQIDDQVLCIECEEQLILVEGNNDDPCQRQCPQGFSQGPFGCVQCHENCRSCWGPGISECLECAQPEEGSAPLYLMEDACVPFCPENGFYMDDTSMKCEECHNSCWGCNGPTDSNCTKCHSDDDTVSDAKDGACTSGADDCGEGCDACFSDAPSICITCEEGYFLQFSSCMETCRDGYYGNIESNECDPCLATCRTCDGPDSCTACIDNYFLQGAECVAVCGKGFYYAEDNKCKACSEHCKRCDSEYECHVCDESYVLKDNNCISDCPDGYTAVNGECWSCHPSCQTCSGPSEDECVTCRKSDGFQLLNNRCTNDCGFGKYKDGDECGDCNNRCLTCDGPASTDCLTCDYYYFRTEDGECVTSCKEKFYEDFEHNNCKRCHSSCQTCIGPGEKDCIDCADGFYLLLSIEETCVKTCPEGYYESEDQGYKDCRTCSYNCKDCTDSYLQCTSCTDGEYLYEDRCQDQCPSGFKEDNTRNICTPNDCPDNCIECNQWGDCIEGGCDEGYIEFFGECVFATECRKDQYYKYNSDYDVVCMDCNPSCASCLGPSSNDCLECAPGQYLSVVGSCVKGCDQYHFFDDETNSCLSCHPSCLTCDGQSPHDCLSCKDELDMVDGMCVFPCKNCGEECHDSCDLCDGNTKNDCISCKDGLYLSGRACVEVCPNGTYHFHPKGSRDGFMCKPCHPNCKTCYEQDSDSCLMCAAELFRQGHTCQSYCNNGSYPDQDSGICQPCGAVCKTCIAKDQCSSCDDEKVLQDGSCLEKCSEHYYSTEMYDKQLVCERCHPECFACSGSSIFDCTECFPGYEIDDGICFSKCAAGYYFNSSMESPCQKCHDLCDTCYGRTSEKCISCPPDQILQRIDINSAKCTHCCGNKEDPSKHDCCSCITNEDGEEICPGYKEPQHRRKNKGPEFHPAPVVFFCMLVVIGFLVIFGLLQARSNRQLCWRDTYARLPTYYDTGSQFVELNTGDEAEEEDDDGKDYFSEDDVYGEVTDDEDDGY